MQDVKPYEPIAVLLLCALCGWLSYEVVGALTANGLSGWGLSTGMAELGERLLSNPFAAYGQPIALMAGVGFGVAPLAIWAVVASNRGNFDPGKEHGDAKMASVREMRAMRDNDTVTNNIVFTKNSGLVVKPKTDVHRRELNGRNHNICCVGTSGTGKTAYVSKPQIMNSVGSALATEAEFSKGWPEADEDEGYDFFLTDPKGDTLRDVGWFLAHAGIDVKVFNTINFRDSLRYNPLAYIDCYKTDVVANPAEELTYKATLTSDDRLIAVLSPRFGLTGCSKLREDHYISIEPEIRSVPVSAIGESVADKFDDPSIAEAMTSIVYQRSTVTFRIVFHHTDAVRHKIRIELEIDDNLEPFRSVGEAGVVVTTRKGADGKKHRVCVISIPASRRISPQNAKSYEYALTCRVRSRNVADGVQLTSVVDCLVANLGASKDEASSADPFWDDAQRLFFMAIISYIIERHGKQWCNLPAVVDYMDMAKVELDGTPSALDCVFEAWETGRKWQETAPAGVSIGHAGMPVASSVGQWAETGHGPHRPDKSLAVHCYKAFRQGAPETLQSIIITSQASCTKLVTEEMRWMLDVDEMHLETLGDAGQRQAIFGIVSDTNPTYEFLLAIMEFQAVNLACDRARLMKGGRLPRHVHFILDEFANIGKLPAFDRVMSVVRSRNISVCLFLQTMKQLEKVYGPNEGAIIQDNCATLLFLGGQSKDTLEMLSDLMGEETVDTINSSKTYGMRGSTSASRQKHGRKLATVSQLRTTPIDKAWVMTIGANPFKDDKYVPGDHPYFKFVSGFRLPGQPECVFPPFSYDDYRDYLAGKRGIPLICDGRESK